MTADDPVVVNFDGLCEPNNPGGYACGGFFVLPHPFFKGQAFADRRCFMNGDGATNNVAEYLAALFALERLWVYKWRGPVLLRGDSQLVVRQFTGEYACKSPLLLPLLTRLRKASECFEELILEWVSREQNHEADHQSRLAYREATGQFPCRRIRKV